ncbi:hypothetical protein [Microbacterium sp.]|uniref:hypothetical protein n=1 Tax=Microbacterium sp. TaxID=51671 RepID=UPI0028127E76|nr:hypothetical protein [Microbacterium sp.]
MLSRRSSVAVAALLAIGLSGCAATPAPTPSPSTTGFVSEEEAFAAAEETYRAYTSSVDDYYGGQNTSDPLQYLVHEARESEEAAQALFDEQGLQSEGSVRIVSFTAQSVSLVAGAAEVKALACLDTSDRVIRDQTGKELNPDADAVIGQEVVLVSINERMRISSTEQVEDGNECTAN